MQAAEHDPNAPIQSNHPVHDRFLHGRHGLSPRSDLLEREHAPQSVRPGMSLDLRLPDHRRVHAGPVHARDLLARARRSDADRSDAQSRDGSRVRVRRHLQPRQRRVGADLLERTLRGGVQAGLPLPGPEDLQRRSVQLTLRPRGSRWPRRDLDLDFDVRRPRFQISDLRHRPPFRGDLRRKMQRERARRALIASRHHEFCAVSS